MELSIERMKHTKEEERMEGTAIGEFSREINVGYSRTSC